MNKKSKTSRYRYILGDSKVEATRLRNQSKLWDPVAHALFDRLKISKGWKVLEIGPGQGSLHLELRRRVHGPIDAVERSPVFAGKLAKLCAKDGLGAGTTLVCDLMDADLPRAHYDLIFARWVFLFLPDPQAHLKKLIRALKPGGYLAIEDYQRETFSMIPVFDDWDAFMAADRALFASNGGDVSIGGRLPELFKKSGLKLIEVVPTIQTGRPGTEVWRWLSDYFLGVMGRYGKLPPFSPEKAARLRRHWKKAASEKTSLLIAPTLLDIVGRKPGRSWTKSKLNAR